MLLATLVAPTASRADEVVAYEMSYPTLAFLRGNGPIATAGALVLPRSARRGGLHLAHDLHLAPLTLPGGGGLKMSWTF
jgi:hypothetical protein